MTIETRLKINISEAATEHFLINPRFTIQSLAGSLNMSAEDIFDLFPNRRAILEYYYESRLYLYQDSITEIDGYDQYTLSEKLSHLFLTLLDSFEEQREFVLTTYKEWVVWNKRKSAFIEIFLDELKTIFTNDPKTSRYSAIIQNRLLWKSILLQFHGLIAFWANDSSRMRENSMALADKWTSFIEEIFYTHIIDKGFDLGKFLWMNASLNKCITGENVTFPTLCGREQEIQEKDHE
ncbi:hypothetical protein [Rhodohalobacter halophilus]|uniref:hypothetical protein n=1 Tax=Rhodohalobacter halophilus TaxID=1812810 RepID=UPI00114CF908|nr:hypothetical protein [Rhodohalobacter halophilus]